MKRIEDLRAPAELSAHGRSARGQPGVSPRHPPRRQPWATRRRGGAILARAVALASPSRRLSPPFPHACPINGATRWGERPGELGPTPGRSCRSSSPGASLLAVAEPPSVARDAASLPGKVAHGPATDRGERPAGGSHVADASDGDGVLVYMHPEVNRIRLTGELRGRGQRPPRRWSLGSAGNAPRPRPSSALEPQGQDPGSRPDS